MIAIVATLRVKDGQGDAFERVIRQMADAVRRNEDGNIFYQATRSRTEANTFKVLEMYRDEDALQAHRAAEHFKMIGAQLGPTLAGRPEVEYLDAIV